MDVRKQLLFFSSMGIGLVLLFGNGAALAQADASSPNGTVPTPSNSATASPAHLEERVKERKEHFKVVLSHLEHEQLVNRCRMAQGVLSKLDIRVKDIRTRRNDIYKQLLERLTSLSGILKENKIDTTTLDNQITALRGRIDAFNKDLSTYETAINDLSTMKCQQDPVAFKASLLAARAARRQVVADSTIIRSYVVDIIKPTLQQILKDILARTGENKPTSNQSTGGSQ